MADHLAAPTPLEEHHKLAVFAGTHPLSTSDAEHDQGVSRKPS